MTAITIERLQAFALSRAVDGGPVSSLAPMPTRNGLLLAATASDGCVGWGEAWCNYPPAGNVAKLGLLRDVIAPQVIGRPFDAWSSLRPLLERVFARMIVHVGEPGPFAHWLAALDMALADIAARRAGLPLAELLVPASPRRVAVYASTPDVSAMEASIGAVVAAGHDAVKLKVGFGIERDEAIVAGFRRVAPAGMRLMVDANQNWDLGAAVEAIARLSQWQLEFVEEPLGAELPAADWAALAAASPVALAAGENINSARRFDELVRAGGLQVVQPDLAKWGGVSGALEVGRQALAGGAACAMHYMGTALGLAASLHALAAIGGPGRVELDANPNPLRTDLGPIDLSVDAGFVKLPPGPGIGFVPDRGAIADYLVAQCDLTEP